MGIALTDRALGGAGAFLSGLLYKFLVHSLFLDLVVEK
jgi:hypothetical protein